MKQKLKHTVYLLIFKIQFIFVINYHKSVAEFIYWCWLDIWMKSTTNTTIIQATMIDFFE